MTPRPRIFARLARSIALVAGAAVTVPLVAVAAPVTAGAAPTAPAPAPVGSAAPVSPGSPASPGSLAPLAPCDGPAPRVTGFGDAAAPVVGWRENLVFDGRGRLWVSNVVTGEVIGYDAAGQRVANVRIGMPGGLAVSPTGEIVVVTGSMVVAPTSQIFAFDPDDDEPTPRLITTLPAGKNGLAVDSRGNMYTTGLFDATVTKVRPDGSVDGAWTRAAAIGGTNGIAIRDDTAFLSTTLAADTVIYEMPLDDPAAARPRVITHLPDLPRGLDDLTVTADAIYAAGMTGGEILRIDRATGAACVLVGGLTGPTSVRAAEQFGGFGPTDLFVTAVDGRIRHVAVG